MNTIYGSKYSQVIEKYKGDFSYRAFADEINAHLLPRKRGKRGFAHWQSIWRGAYKPEDYLVDYLVNHATGWVRDFALEMAALLEGE